MSYKDLLLDPRWQKKRLAILNRDKFTCKYCGDTKNTLHVHHFYYGRSNAPWDVEDSALVTLCEDCHKIDHLKNLSPLEGEIINQLQTLKEVYGCNKKYKFIQHSIRAIQKVIIQNHNL